MKLLSLVGARPQFIKLAPLSNVLRTFHSEFIVHTGQHFDKEMSDTFFSELNIPEPDCNLNIQGGNHGKQTGEMMIKLEKVVLDEKPDIMIVFGDTNTTLAGALVGSKLHIPVIHIEAGLRSFNKQMPEEINRIVADHTSAYLFAPTQTAMDNLKDENLASKSYLTGDIMVDALKGAIDRVQDRTILDNIALERNNYYLLTLHRPYNVDDPEKLTKILKELSKLSKTVVFPVHPRTRRSLENRINGFSNIKFVKPAGYLDFIALQSNAYKIITDSGGIQKEAYILKKPCITLRPETEWVETKNAGWNLLLNPGLVNNLSHEIESFQIPQKYDKIFGDNVAVRMVEIINNISSNSGR